ncbi:MAG TPA: MBL fold metallo-hydrolase [Polyangiaceae bacterium]|nr:MBL fold metallo-hydrolase [Polyangiaceae bacterium]
MHSSLLRPLAAGVVFALGVLSPQILRADAPKAGEPAKTVPVKPTTAAAKPAAVAEPAAATQHVLAANALAKGDLTTPLFLCRADSGNVVRQNLESGSKKWLEPSQIFDNLYYVGNEFVGVLVLRTSAGLILFDSSSSADEAEHRLVPGLVKLGLNPKDIKYVVVTHGHWDHFGGAAYLQQTYAAKIALGAADWDLIEKAPPHSLEASEHPIPKREIAVIDGQKLTLGDTTVKLYVTPGHTPATVSAIVPVRDRGTPRTLSLYGSVAFPPSLEPTERVGGLRKYDQSVQRFADISKQAGAVGILNTHVFADGGLARLNALRTRKPSEPNPFLIGAEATSRYYGILHECLQAAQARPQVASDWSKPLVTPPANTPAAAHSSKQH